MTKTFRSITLALCTLASAPGGTVGLLVLLIEGSHCGQNLAPPKPCGPLELVQLALAPVNIYAWFCYMAMGFAWIEGTKIARWVPISGTISALSYCALSLSAARTLSEMPLAFAFPLVFVLPAVLLAIYLVLHHLLSLGAQFAAVNEA